MYNAISGDYMTIRTEDSKFDAGSLLAELSQSVDALSSEIGTLKGQLVPPEQMGELYRSIAGVREQVEALYRSGQNKVVEIDPARLQAQIMRTIGNSRALLDQAKQAARAAEEKLSGDAQATLAAVTAEAHRLADRTQRALFDDKIFDPSLRFASNAEEEAYRQREEQRRGLLDGLDPNDPNYERNRLLIQQAQLDDAMKHGADRDPRAAQMRAEIEAMLRKQREAEIAAGRDPAEYDREVEAFRNGLPGHTSAQQTEEKAVYLARGWKADASLTAGDGNAVARSARVAVDGDKSAVVAAGAKEEAVAPLTTLDLDDAEPVNHAINQLKAAGVSAAHAAHAESPSAPARNVAQAGVVERNTGLV